METDESTATPLEISSTDSPSPLDPGSLTPTPQNEMKEPTKKPGGDAADVEEMDYECSQQLYNVGPNEVGIISRGYFIKIPKNLLIKKSQFFATQLEINESTRIFELRLPLSVLIILDKYVKSEHFKVSEAVVSGLLKATTLLGFNEFTQTCLRFLDSHMTINTSLKVANIIESYNLQKSYPKAHKVALWEFSTISCCSIFFQNMCAKSLHKYLSYPVLRVSSEVAVFEAIERYMETSKQSGNSKIFRKLLQTINFPTAGIAEIVRMGESKFVQGDSWCVRFLAKILNYRLKQETEATSPPQTNDDKELEGAVEWARQKEPRRLPLVPLVVGVSTLQSQRYLDVCSFFEGRNVFNLDDELSLSVRNLKVVGSFTICALGSIFYVVGCTYDRGGMNDNPNHNVYMWSYDVIYSIWRMEVKLPTPRAFPTCCVLGHFIYTVGGSQYQNGSMDASSVFEKYNTLTKQWIALKELPKRVIHAACTGFEDNIYLFVRRQIYRYDPLLDTWTELQEQNILDKHSPHSAFVYAQRIHLVGKYSIFTYVPEMTIGEHLEPASVKLAGRFPNATQKAVLCYDDIFAFHATKKDCSVLKFNIVTKECSKIHHNNLWVPLLQHGITLLPKYEVEETKVSLANNNK